jgi:hypothetical protein
MQGVGVKGAQPAQPSEVAKQAIRDAVKAGTYTAEQAVELEKEVDQIVFAPDTKEVLGQLKGGVVERPVAVENKVEVPDEQKMKPEEAAAFVEVALAASKTTKEPAEHYAADEMWDGTESFGSSAEKDYYGDGKM